VDLTERVSFTCKGHQYHFQENFDDDDDDDDKRISRMRKEIFLFLFVFKYSYYLLDFDEILHLCLH
jgi:hypothetical protein